MLVYADDVALHQRVGPVAVEDVVCLCLCAEGEEVVLTGGKKGGREGKD